MAMHSREWEAELKDLEAWSELNYTDYRRTEYKWEWKFKAEQKSYTKKYGESVPG